VELEEWRQQILSNGDAKRILDDFSSTLTDEGWTVDDSDYFTMVRIKGKGVESLVGRVPIELTYTFNLGYLDVQLPGCGKLAATRWISSRIRMALETTTLPSSSSSSSSAPLDEGAYLFMGDDDNDVEIAASAREAFVTEPCSAVMRRFVESWKAHKLDPTMFNTVNRDGETTPDSSEPVDEWRVHGRPVTVYQVHEAPMPTHAGTEALLATVLQRFAHYDSLAAGRK
jgi:hypothetical protein